MTDRWSYDSPALNVGRVFHSSCSLGDCIYVFGGRDRRNAFLNSIECLDVAKLLTGKYDQWALI